MSPLNIKDIASKLYSETKQVKQVVKFNFKKAEICFRDVETGIKLPYTTNMHARYSYTESVSEWDMSKWIVFVRDAVDYYQKNSKLSLDIVHSITLFTGDKDLCMTFIL